MKEKFFLCYYEVFNEDGSRKACGREKCIRLIELAEKICPEAEPGKFGSKNNGFMNEESLKDLKKYLS